MATATLTITDGPNGVIVRIDSDPRIPMNGDLPDVENLTDAQAAAIYAGQALHDVAGVGEWRTLVR
jgi:hypothetical protein